MTPTHVIAFVKGTEKLRTLITENDLEPLTVDMKREALEYLLWSRLNDTPYTRGEQTLANWNSKDDFDKACGYTEEFYKKCACCEYTWPTLAYWEEGKGRVAFKSNCEGIEGLVKFAMIYNIYLKGDEVVCSMCWKGVEEYFPSVDEDED